MTEPAPAHVIARVHTRITVNENGCWIWGGGKSQGYGRVGWRKPGKTFYASTHRLLYIEAKGPIPEGMDLDHLCHDPATCPAQKATDCPHRACCNPAHLSPATRQENLLRGGTLSAERRAVTHCPQGHELTEENTLVSTRNQRSCKQCVYERNRAYYWKNAEKRRAYNKAWRERQSG